MTHRTGSPRATCLTTTAMLLGVAVGASMGCASTPPNRLDDPPLAVTVTATGLRAEEREALRAQICEIPGVSSCVLEDVPPPATDAAVDDASASEKPPAEKPEPKKKKKKKKSKGEKADADGADADTAPPEAGGGPTLGPAAPVGDARVVFSFNGSLGELRYRISTLPHPGLEVKTATVALDYRGFDNQAPTVTIEKPTDGIKVAEKYVDVIAVVPDQDLMSVRIADKDALVLAEGRFAGDADLKEGDNVVTVRAADHSGNATEKSVRVFVDTTPPDVQVEIVYVSDAKVVVKAVVTGATKVTCDGKPVTLDGDGRFSRDILVDPDKSTVEVVAEDALGNTTRIKRSTRKASPLSADSMKPES